MEIGEALKTYLLSYSNLTALIGQRLHPDKLPQKPTYPACVFQQISTYREHAFRQDTGTAAATFQITSFGSTRKSAKDTAKQVRLALQNYSGVMGGDGGVNVKAILIQNEMDDYDVDNDGRIIEYSTIQDFEIWYEE